MSTKFCITLTTIPTRLNTIHKTINSIQHQTLKPNKIFLNIPYKYYRFPGVTISNEELINLESDLVEINRCDDFGPATKIMGSLNKVKDFDCAIIVDDDHVYNEKMCQIFIREFEKEKMNYSYYIQKIFDINMAQCADGFLINSKYLNDIVKFYNLYVKQNRNMFLDDDLWISIYLQIIKDAEIKNLINIFREETNKKLVYEVHSNVDALSDIIHSPKKFINRRKIAKFEYLKFRIKNYFNNFNQL
tara:strand:- start:3719 stop:4456 length:738 start_codon:yes stop_codon:yes gene_type:complete